MTPTEKSSIISLIQFSIPDRKPYVLRKYMLKLIDTKWVVSGRS